MSSSRHEEAFHPQGQRSSRTLSYPNPDPTPASTSTFVLPPSTSTSTLRTISSSDSTLSMAPETSKTASKGRKGGNPIPRPPNAWICYRSARVHELKTTSQYSKMPQASISKLIGELWRSESPEVKQKYEREAAVKKLEHQAKYPDYSFRPVRKEQQRKSSLKKVDSSHSKKSSKANELPSVLRPGPPTTASGLPMSLPSPGPSEQRSQLPPSPRDEEYPHSSSSTSSSFPPSPLYPPAEYHLPQVDFPLPALAPIDTSHQHWTMFQPVEDYLPTPPFDSSRSRAPTPPFYYPSSYTEPYNYALPSHCPSVSSSSSQSFDQIHQDQAHFDQFVPYSPPYFSPERSEPSSLSLERWGLPSASSVNEFAENSYLPPQNHSYIYH